MVLEITLTELEVDFHPYSMLLRKDLHWLLQKFNTLSHEGDEVVALEGRDDNRSGRRSRGRGGVRRSRCVIMEDIIHPNCYCIASSGNINWNVCDLMNRLQIRLAVV